jgi:ubiquinone/menaquinone biosynthesis C-methylase UbiE
MPDTHDRKVSTYFDSAASTFDTFYEGQRNAFMRWVDRQFRSDMFERFRLTFEAIEPLAERTVLDIGCGSGPYAVEAAKRGARRVVGIDLAEGMLDLARRRAAALGVAERCEFVQGAFPAEAPQEMFDYAIVMGVMDYVAKPEEFLSVLAQRVGRRAVLSFPSTHWFRTPLRKVRYWIKRCPVYFFEADGIRALMTAAGFTDVRIEKIPGAGMDYVAIGNR